MQFRIDEVDLMHRVEFCETTRSKLSDQEAQALLDSYIDDRFSCKTKLYRDRLIPFLPRIYRDTTYVAAVAKLSAEIDQYEIYEGSEVVYSSDPFFEDPIVKNVVAPTNTAKEEYLELLKQRLKVLTDISWKALFSNGRPSSWVFDEIKTNDLLFCAACKIKEPTVAGRLSEKVILSCDDYDEQRGFICALLSTFPDSERIKIKLIDLICSESINERIRLGLFEDLFNHTMDQCISSLSSIANEGLKRYKEILPREYYDEHLVRFLKAVNTRFSFDHIQYVLELTRPLQIDIGITDLTIPEPLVQTESTGRLTLDLPALETGLKTYVDSLRKEYILRTPQLPHSL